MSGTEARVEEVRSHAGAVGSGRQRRRGIAVTQAARRSCPWVGMMLELLKVSRGAHPQQQHSYLEQRRRHMIMHCSARAVGLVGRRRDVPGGWEHHVGTRAGNTSGAPAAQRLPTDARDAPCDGRREV